MFEGVKQGLQAASRTGMDDAAWAFSDSMEFFGRDSGGLSWRGARPDGAAGAAAAAEAGVSLRGRSIPIEHGADLFGNSAYTVIVDFMKVHETDKGYLVRFDGSYSVFVAQRSIRAKIVTDRGEREISSGEVRLLRLRWYRLALTFSGVTGRADLYLDGRRLCATRDLAGARQCGDQLADLYIGCPAGESFSGRIDNFRLFDRALKEQTLPSR